MLEDSSSASLVVTMTVGGADVSSVLYRDCSGQPCPSFTGSGSQKLSPTGGVWVFLVGNCSVSWDTTSGSVAIVSYLFLLISLVGTEYSELKPIVTF